MIDASPLDAQNIFSLVNGNGVTLTAEELLSARPFWNLKVENPSQEVISEAHKTYEFLEITVPSDVVRWDVCATLISRIDKSHLIFSPFDFSNSKTKDTLFTRKLTLGFKLLSAVYVGGISSNSVKELEVEKKVKVDWNKDVDKFVEEFNRMLDLLTDMDFFKFMNQWNQSIMSLMGNSVVLEFSALIYKNWKEDLEEPTKSSSNASKFKKNAAILFDRLVYEYSSRLWTGSGDSRLASDLKNRNERFVPVSASDWQDLIVKFENGENSSFDKALIYHYTCLKQIHPNLVNTSTKSKYEIDHIIAQDLFENAVMVDKSFKDSIGNKAPLPKNENITKSNKTLAQLKSDKNNKWIYDETLRVSGIKETEVDKFSDVSNAKELVVRRIDDYKKTFDKARTAFFNNIK